MVYTIIIKINIPIIFPPKVKKYQKQVKRDLNDSFFINSSDQNDKIRINLFDMNDNNLSEIQFYFIQIDKIVKEHHYQRIVLQISKQFLQLSFKLISLLIKSYPQCQFFTLYDSLKQSCCTDLLGAEHIGYDCLIHLGRACFSSQYRPNIHFIFNRFLPQRAEIILDFLKNQSTIKELQQKSIKYILVSQQYYQFTKNNCFIEYQLQNSNIQLLRLQMDATKEDEYLVFGYYGIFQADPNNLLIIDGNQLSQFDQQTTLSENMALVLKSKLKQIKQLFTLSLQSKSIGLVNCNNNKRLMQRFSLISQLQEYTIFGIIVSNTATSFHKQALLRCQQILKKQKKKTFTFMMNNLNEVKLGNFPQIQVYVIISCFNNSLFSIKDFHKITVTPHDLQIAFQGIPFDQYTFDCQNITSKKIGNEEEIKLINQKQQLNTLELEKNHSEIALASKIQTLDFYRERQFKGLSFTEKKQIKKATKGKIGLAQQYKNLQ